MSSKHEHLYDQLNLTSQTFPQDLSIHQWIDQQCERTPERIAVVHENRRQTYAQLKRLSDQIASHLIRKGIGPGSLVGLCCQRRLEMPAMLVGIMKSGAGYVPLDPDYPQDRLQFMAEDSNLDHVIVNENLVGQTESFDVPTTVWEREIEAIQQLTSAPIPQLDSVKSIAYVIYTSGSTGKPKGVLVPHCAAVNMLNSIGRVPGFSMEDRILATTTLSFDISVVEMFLPLVKGGSVAVVDRSTAKDPARLVQAIEAHQVTIMQATPAMWRMILEADFDGGPHMKFFTGGEPLPRDLIDPMLSRSGEVWNLYGPTETTVYSTGMRILNSQDRILIGKPVDNTQIYIVDENNNLCGPETPGEMLIGGTGVTQGYLNRPELNDEKFVSFNGSLVYRTGDLAQITESGLIDHLGRIDGQIKLNGHRIELGEIDATIASFDGVRQAATVLREDQPGDHQLVAYILPHDNAEIDLSGLKQVVAKQLPDYMVPSTYVVVDQFHYTPSGKLDRKAFPAPSTQRPEIDTDFVAPVTDLERAMASIWESVLQLDRVGIHDNFLELGGTSIRAARIIAHANQQMGLRLTSGDLFDCPTIERLLDRAETRGSQTTQIKRRPLESQSVETEFAIVGLSARMPGAANVDEYWNNLIEGKESIRWFEPGELDPTLDPRDTSSENYVPARGIIEGADQFDARFFRIPPRNAEMLDPQQRIMLELAWSALEDAGVIPSKSKDVVGVWAGTYSTDYYTRNVLTNPERVHQTGQFQTGVYNEKDYIATRVAHALNLTGPAINVNTACSTSLVAVIEACKSLAFGQCDVAIAGAASVTFPQNCGHLHQVGSIFTPDGHCRPFDRNGAGTLFSDGAGVVVLKKLSKAIEQGDRIYAVIKGFGINNDGGDKASFTAPSIQGQANAVSMAYSQAGFSPDSVSYVEAHGTATPIGDPIEVAALQSVFESETDRKQFCAIGSVKSNIGHTVAAAGVAGLIKTVKALHHEQIPATLHYTESNPEIDFPNSPFYVCDKNLDWSRCDQPRRAGVSAFGVGGTNAHVLLEEAPTSTAAQDPSHQLPIEIVPVSAKTKSALEQQLSRLGSHLGSNQTVNTADISWTLKTRRDEFAHRAVVLARTGEELQKTLQDRTPMRFFRDKVSGKSREVVFMFPGQGAQYVQMGHNLYQHSEVFRRSMDHCAEQLQPLLKRDLRDILFPADGDESVAQEILRATQFTQPALFATGYSLAQLWMSWGIQPTKLIGHSIGEFAAACVAGVFSLEDGCRMIAERGRAMQSLPGGSMMSVRLPGQEVEPLLGPQMAIASYNGPSLCVVAGTENDIAQLQQELESREVVCRHLHTSHAFHSPMMDAIVKPFSQFVSAFELSKPSIPICSTVTGKWMTEQEATDPNYWARHLRAPVQFSGAVSRVWDEDPTRILIELGPRRTLATLAKQHAVDPKNQLSLPTLADNANDDAEWWSTLGALGQLWAAGVTVDWNRISSDGHAIARKHISLPTYPFEHKSYFIAPGQTVKSTTPTEACSDGAHVIVTSSDRTTTTQPLNTRIAEPKTMSRIPNLLSAIHEVFENTSGFDLAEFESDTTFFEMGLDSLVLTQTATALKKEMGVEVTFRQLLEETPTTESLAKFLDAHVDADRFQPDAVEPIQPEPSTSSSVSPEHPPVSQPNAQESVNPVPSHSAPAPAPVHSPTPSQPMLMNSAPGTQAIIQNQLQIMAAQLQLLGGQDSMSPLPQTVEPTQVADTKASQPGVTVQDQPPIPTPSQETSPETKPSSETKSAKKAFGAAARVKLNDGTLDEKQQQALDDIIRQHNKMTPESKAYAQRHRRYMADPRTVSGFRPNMKEMTHPLVVERSKGVYLWDIDGNEYIDFTCGFGSNFLGHTHDITVAAITDQVQKDYAIGPQSPLAGEVAQLFCELTGNERMAFSNTGSEAVLGCTRLARTATGRDKIVMFTGDYHGILDEVIVRGSKSMRSFPAATGIPKDHVTNAVILEYGTDEALEYIRDNLDDLAAVLVEPVQSRRPELQPKEFLQKLSKITEDAETALIFDEVISGLRIGMGGAQEYFGVKADLASYGKVVGGGMPIGLIGGKSKYMDGLDGGYWQYGDDSRPEAGMTYFAGTFVRHPLTLAASKAIMEFIKEGGQPMYDRLNKLSDYLANQLNQVFQELDAPMFLAHFGSLFKVQFHEELVYGELLFAALRRRGMHIWDHRPCLLTVAHTQDHVDRFVNAFRDSILEMQRFGFLPGQGYENSVAQFDPNCPPQAGAQLGNDRNGNPGWFIPDEANPGRYLQIGTSAT